MVGLGFDMYRLLMGMKIVAGLGFGLTGLLVGWGWIGLWYSQVYRGLSLLLFCFSCWFFVTSIWQVYWVRVHLALHLHWFVCVYLSCCLLHSSGRFIKFGSI